MFLNTVERLLASVHPMVALTVAGLLLGLLAVSRGTFSLGKWLVQDKVKTFEGHVENLRSKDKWLAGEIEALERRTSAVETKVDVLDDRTIRLEPLIKELNALVWASMEQSASVRELVKEVGARLESQSTTMDQVIQRIDKHIDQPR